MNIRGYREHEATEQGDRACRGVMRKQYEYCIRNERNSEVKGRKEENEVRNMIKKNKKKVSILAIFLFLFLL